MGLSIEFYAGDAARIGAAFSAIQFDQIRNGTKAIAYADFSLHVGMEDLDLLSIVISDHTKEPLLLLLDHLTTNVGTMDDEGSADIVDPAWVTMVAALDVADAPDVAAEWIRRVGESLEETLEPTTAAATAVGQLVGLCRKAILAQAEVVCAWYL